MSRLLILTLWCAQLMQGPADSAFAAAKGLSFSEDAQLLGAVLDDGTISIWDSHSGELKHLLQREIEWVKQVRVLHGRSEFATVGNRSEIRFWRTRDGVLVDTIAPAEADVTSMTASPDGRMLAVGTGEGAIHLIETSKRRLTDTIQSSSNSPIMSLSFSRDGTWLVEADSDCVRVRDTRSWTEYGAYCDLAEVIKAELILAEGASDDTSLGTSRLVIARDSEHYEAVIEILPLDGGGRTRISVEGTELQDFALSSDGRLMALATSVGVEVWRLEEATRVFATPLEAGPTKILFDDNGGAVIGGDRDGKIHRWNLEGRLERTYQAHPGRISSLALDDRQLLSNSTGSLSGALAAWDLDTLRQLWVAGKVSSGEGFKLEFVPGAAELVTASRDRLWVWDLNLGILVRALLPNCDEVADFDVSPDGETILVGGRHGELSLLDLAEGSNRSYFDIGAPIRQVAFSGGGKRFHVLTSGDRIWSGTMEAFPADLSESEGPECQKWLLRKGVFACVAEIPGLMFGVVDGNHWHQVSGFSSVAVKMDVSGLGDTIAVLDRNGRVNAIVQDKVVAQRELAAGALFAVSPDGRRMAVFEAGALQVWAFPSLIPLAEYPGGPSMELEVSALAEEIYRLDFRRIGRITLKVAEACGTSSDGRCLTTESHILIRIRPRQNDLRDFTIDLSNVKAGTSRKGLLGLERHLHSNMFAFRLRGGVDLAAGDTVTVDGLIVSASPELVGEGRYADRFFSAVSDTWENRELWLPLWMYPTLDSPIEVLVEAWPRSIFRFRSESVVVARPPGP